LRGGEEGGEKEYKKRERGERVSECDRRERKARRKVERE
jgi:hypothetical protein